MYENVETSGVEMPDLVSYGSGNGSRASHRNSQGRLGNKNAAKGSVTRTRNRIAAAQAANRGRGSRNRRAQLNDLATTARGNNRGNVNRRTLRGVQNEIARLTREMNGN